MPSDRCYWQNVWGKKRIIAETGAGQHGVATATVCALMNMQCIVYMGKTDVERQHINVEKMKMLGAEVRPVTSGNMTLKDATNEAIRAAFELTRLEGIIPALESAHALGALDKMRFKPTDIVVLTVSGRGDKDIETYLKESGTRTSLQ